MAPAANRRQIKFLCRSGGGLGGDIERKFQIIAGYEKPAEGNDGKNSPGLTAKLLDVPSRAPHPSGFGIISRPGKVSVENGGRG